jgi:hypothetical protein
MSNKQITHAALKGRKVTFRFLGSQPYHEVAGYIVGLDDYHWLVATPVPVTEWGASQTDEPITVAMVHKGRADLILISSTSLLAAEHSLVRTAVEKIGTPFWETLLRNDQTTR